MTWQGGKKAKEAIVPPVAFARLRPLMAGQKADEAGSLKSLSQALRNYGSAVRIHIHLGEGADGEKVDHWDVEGGSAKATARNSKPKNADVHVVMRPETRMQIAQGRMAPYDALFGGRLRVGGDLEKAKSIIQHLSDPAVPYVPPC
jgi:putative sterol carrier protein